MFNLRLYLCHLLVIPFLFSPFVAYADEDQDLGWSSAGRFSLVNAEGNGDFIAAGLDLSLGYAWSDASFDVGLGAQLARNQIVDRIALGTPDDFSIEKLEEDQTLAENYALSFTHQKGISPRFAWVTHGSWERDEPSGFRNRYSIGMGLGLEREGRREGCLQTLFSLTWNRQENLVVLPDSDPTFPGFRLVFGYTKPLHGHTDFETNWTHYGNIDDIDDYRSVWKNTLTTSINEWLAFEVEAQWQYASRPLLVEVPLLGSDSGVVFDELDEHETSLTVALVLQR